MNEMRGTQAKLKQSWTKRLLAAIGSWLFEGIGPYEWGTSPNETRMLMIHWGFGWDEAMMVELLMGMKQYDDKGLSDAG